MSTTGHGDWQVLIERLTAGDDAARDELIAHCAQQLRRQAGRMLARFPGVYRWEQTDDVLQNALMRLHQSLSRVQPTTVRGFLGLASEHIRRELIDLYRKHCGPQGIGANHASVAGVHSERALGEAVLESRDPCDGPATWMARQDWNRRIHEAVERLPEQEREVVSLRFYHGLGEAEIAEMQGVSVRTVRRRWRQARLLLFEALQAWQQG